MALLTETLPPLDWRDADQRNLAYDSSFSSDFNYRRIRLEGEYLADKEARVFTSLPAESAKGPASGPGYLIMTPFRLADANYAVWVNRGFVPEGADWAPPPAGRVTVTGLVRPDDPPHWLTPESKPGKNLFFARSVAALSQAKGLPPGGPDPPFTIDLLPEAGGWRVRASHGLDAAALRSRDFLGSVGALERAIQTGEAVVLNDIGTDPALAQRASIAAAGLRSVLALPLKQGERLLAVVYADSRRAGAAITEIELELLRAFAERAALWIAARQGAASLEQLAGPAPDWHEIAAVHRTARP